MEVVAGVNIPMLVGNLHGACVTTTRSFDELVALAVETGREGVKALRKRSRLKNRPLALLHQGRQHRRSQWVRTITWLSALREY